VRFALGWMQLIAVLFLLGGRGSAQQPSMHPSSIEVQLTQPKESTPLWLEVIDKVSWPLVVLAAIAIFHKPLSELVAGLTGAGTEFSIWQLKVRIPQLEKKVQDQKDALESQQEKINNLIKFSMSYYIYKMLYEVQKAQRTHNTYIFRDDNTMDRNLRYLTDHGFIQEIGHVLNDGTDICPIIMITKQGQDVIDLRGLPEGN
jgi:hypothetical protein